MIMIIGDNDDDDHRHCGGNRDGRGGLLQSSIG